MPSLRNNVFSLRDIGEFGLIHRIRKWFSASNPALIKGIGDDVAVIEAGKKVWLVTTDLLIEDIHFRLTWIDPFHLGRKSLLVNLSDIAAMGGTPKYFLISLGVPKDLSLSFLSSFYRGLRDGAKRFGVDLIGGDTSVSQKIIINICLLGEGKRGRLLFRSGAKVGDDLFVSGTLGDAALGLKLLQRNGLREKPKRLIQRHHSPSPRIQLGQALARHRGATAMIDVSDGLLIDARHLLEESGVGAQIWEDRIPLSNLYQKWIHLFSKSPSQFALSGGEDYELLFTVRPEMREKVSDLARSSKIPITHIGKIVPKSEGLHVIGRDGQEYSPTRLGYEHFKT
ncbi:MAG: thiamine-phosphate kinase [Thermodesulfobacteriota bacterium]